MEHAIFVDPKLISDRTKQDEAYALEILKLLDTFCVKNSLDPTTLNKTQISSTAKGVKVQLGTEEFDQATIKEKAIKAVLEAKQDYALIVPHKKSFNDEKLPTEQIVAPYFPFKDHRSAENVEVLVFPGSFNPLHLGHEQMALHAIKYRTKQNELAKTPKKVLLLYEICLQKYLQSQKVLE